MNANKLRTLTTGLLALSTALLARASVAQEQHKYESIEASDLIRSPQKYWALPITFRDVLLTLPKGRDIEIAEKLYTPFTTKALGTCYALKDLAPLMNKLDVKRNYIFSGTVLNNRDRYYIVVNAFSGIVESDKLSEDMTKVVANTEAAVADKSLKPVADAFWEAQRAHYSYAKEKNIPLSQLYDPASEHYTAAVDMTRAAVHAQEQKMNVPANELLAQYLFYEIRSNYSPGAEPKNPEPAVEEETEKPEEPVVEERTVEAPAQPAPVVATPPPPAATETPPPAPVVTPPPVAKPAATNATAKKMSFWQSWRLERQKNAAVKAEQKRIADQKRQAELQKKKEAEDAEKARKAALQERLRATAAQKTVTPEPVAPVKAAPTPKNDSDDVDDTAPVRR